MSGYPTAQPVGKPALVERVTVEGFDITNFRGQRIPDMDRGLVQPLGYNSGRLRVPAVKPYVESNSYGTGELWWVREGLIVLVQACDPDTGEVVHTRWRGRTGRPSGDLGLVINCDGLLVGAANTRNKQVPQGRNEPEDIGTHTWRTIERTMSGYYGAHFTPHGGPTVGISIAETGGMTELDWMYRLCTMSTTRSGEQHTIMPTEAGGNTFEMRPKDHTTVHYTAWVDGVSTKADLSRDEGHNVWFLTGIRPDGGYFDGTVFPGVFNDPNAPAFPGTPLSLGSTGTDVQTLSWKMLQTGLIDREDGINTFTQDHVDGTKTAQKKGGLPVTGIVDEATWNVIYDIDVDEWSLGGAHIEPLVQDPRVRKWNISPGGNYRGLNAEYDPTIPQRHRNVDLGYGITMPQAVNWAEGQMARVGDQAKVGTVTLTGVGVFAGEWLDGGVAPAGTDVVPGRDIQAGCNLWLANHFGGVLVHIVEVDVSPGEGDSPDVITLTVDTGYRDALELDEILKRNQDSQRDERRNWKHDLLGSKKIHDVISPFHIKAGIVAHKYELIANKWTAIPIFASAAGTLSLFDITTVNPHAETCGVILADSPTGVHKRRSIERELNRIVPDPWTVDDDGEPIWTDPALRHLFERRLILHTWGTREQPGGYWPKLHTNADGDATSAPLNGRWRTDSSIGYYTFGLPALWVCVMADRDCEIEPGRIARAQLQAAA